MIKLLIQNGLINIVCLFSYSSYVLANARVFAGLERKGRRVHVPAVIGQLFDPHTPRVEAVVGAGVGQTLFGQGVQQHLLALLFRLSVIAHAVACRGLKASACSWNAQSRVKYRGDSNSRVYKEIHNFGKKRMFSIAGHIHSLRRIRLGFVFF